MAKVAKMEDERTGTGYLTKECPKCDKTKDVDTDFGWRLSKGKIIMQSWCRQCRGLSAILGPSKDSWDALTQRQALEAAKEKREFLRKPRKGENKPDRLPTYKEENKKLKEEKSKKLPGLETALYLQQVGRGIRTKAAPKIITDCSVLTAGAKPPAAPKNDPPAPTKKVTPDPVADDKVVWLSADLGSTKVLFAKHFPDDKQLRSWKTMIQRLLKKLGDRAQLTKTAKERLGQ